MNFLLENWGKRRTPEPLPSQAHGREGLRHSQRSGGVTVMD